MKVARYVDGYGRPFYNADFSPELMAETVNRMGGCQRIDFVEMTRAEYDAIPATNESAALWRAA